MLASVFHLSIQLSSIFDDAARKVFTLFVEMATRVCPVVVDGQVSICGRYSHGTKTSQQPGEVASVRGIAFMLRRAYCKMTK